MKIIIAKQNQDILKKYCSGINFMPYTKNLVIFNWPESKFNGLYNWVKNEGINPFALMTW